MGKSSNLGGKNSSSGSLLTVMTFCGIAINVIAHGAKMIANKKTVKNVSDLGRKSAENFKKIK